MSKPESLYPIGEALRETYNKKPYSFLTLVFHFIFLLLANPMASLVMLFAFIAALLIESDVFSTLRKKEGEK